MGIFSKLTGIFKRKKKDDILKDLPPLPPLTTKTDITSESATVGNVKARMDLVLTQMDSLRVQYETMSERLANIEKMIKELYEMAKSS